MESHRILVLNQTYEPLSFCTPKRAIKMVYKGKAEEVEVDSLLVRTPTYTFRLPSVIRLLRYISRPYKVGGTFSKKNVVKRDSNTCQYCGRKYNEMTIDHVIPRSRGGMTCWENAVVACKQCNIKKGDRALRESRMQLIREPKQPAFLFYLNLAQVTTTNFHESWNKYLPFEVVRKEEEAPLPST